MKLRPIDPITLFAGEVVTLAPILLDVENNVQAPTQRITYRSNNPSIVVTDGGVIATNTQPTQFSRRGSSIHGNVQVSHGSINATVDVRIIPFDDDVISD